jgi:hypothetical protein
MKVEIFTLCHYAQADPGGNLTIIGAFDHIAAIQVPVTVMPMCAVACRLRFERIEEGRKNITISIMDSDGQRVLPALSPQIPVNIRQGESTVTVPIVMLIGQLKLPTFGEYQIDLAVDGRIEASIPIYVRKVEHPGHRPR